MSDTEPDQKRILEWLYEQVPNFDPPGSDLLSMISDDEHLPPKPQKIEEEKPSAGMVKLRDPSQTPNIPRIDLYQKLLDVYETERLRWVEFRNSARPKDDDIQKLNAYDKLLTTYAPVIDAKLEALWAVVLNPLPDHRARKYISDVDNETASETLQHAKEALRASVSRGIDDTEDVYPTALTPDNWSKYLSTNSQPEDLLADADITRNALRAAEKEEAITEA
ncbi:hypothetical protein BJ166DRAFT_596924 [Pestalotiopsis sp. NC0098]|nr:hypothetical protein BJ166DRAFT_596924 [Pestalotiopsis sp. NC0098]